MERSAATGPRTVIVGLTGGIACGKSTVSAWLARRGARIIDADRIARALVEPGTPGLLAVVARFGPEMLDLAGRLDRARLGARVFANPQELASLNAILHPRIAERVRAELDAARHDGVALAVVDAALLLELGLDTACDAVLAVECEPSQQVERLVRTRGLDPAQARQRLAAQWNQAQRRAKASAVIDNRGTLDQLEREIRRAWASLDLGLALPSGA